MSGSENWASPVDLKATLERARAIAADLDDDVHEREDSCSCFKPRECYGAHGWHWEIADESSPQGDIAYERCERYWDKVENFRTDGEKGAPW